MTLPTANQFRPIAIQKGRERPARIRPTRIFSGHRADLFKAESRRSCARASSTIQIECAPVSYYIDPEMARHIQEEMGVIRRRRSTKRFASTTRVWKACSATADARDAPVAAGNNRSQWIGRGLRPDRRRLFNQLNVRRVLLEYESGARRHVRRAAVVPRTKAVRAGAR